MWPDRRLCDLFSIEHPILQAPMAGSSTVEMAQAVSNAGGLGALACARVETAEMDALAEALRRGTNRPFNMNFFATPATPAPSRADVARVTAPLGALAGELDVSLPEEAPGCPAGYDAGRHARVLALKPAVASFHFGLPDAAQMADLKAAGIVVIATATTVAEARALEAAGVDAIVAQGFEAGGHRGSFDVTPAQAGIGTLALVPQIADAVGLPVIAAGGIADGRGIAAALALGAAGVQIGTAFLRAPEAATDDPRRRMIAVSDGSDTMMTAAVSGRPARALRSRYAETMAPLDGALLPFGSMYAVAGPLLEAAARRGRDDASFHLYGQAAGLAREMPAGDILAWLVEDTRRALARVGIAP